LINATLRVNLADAESQLRVTNTQLSVARSDLEASKILLSDHTQQALLEIQNRFAIKQQEHLVTKQHSLIAQHAFSDFQDIVSSAQQFKLEVEYLRRDRDRALHALNLLVSHWIRRSRPSILPQATLISPSKALCTASLQGSPIGITVPRRSATITSPPTRSKPRNCVRYAPNTSTPCGTSKL
jgi:hypothetical protein